jgi:hypothetical protein
MERDNWENTGIDDFAERRRKVCRLCGDDKDEDATTCETCRAQPARINDAD